MYHIAATLGCTVRELEAKLSFPEYLGWIQYFEEMNSDEKKKPNLLADETGQGLLQGMQL